MGQKILFVMTGAVMLVGAISFQYQLYQIVKLDAETRGIPHPKLWGVVSSGVGKGDGLLSYFIRRKKFPVIKKSENNSHEIFQRKRRAFVSICFFAVGTIGLLFTMFF